MPGTAITNDLRNPPTATEFVEPWHHAAHAMCGIITGVSELADLLQGHPELLRYNFAGLEPAHQALGRILDFVKRNAVR